MSPGLCVAHYRVTAELGEGGMGAVYRATDTKLGREIALKVLPAEMARDQDRLARFQREARAVAGLNHANIVTLYSVEESDGVHFLTMELIEGQPLDRLIPPNGLPAERIVEISVALSEALAAAHEKGVVHRDLKPSNVMVADDGRIKVLDFGLAKEMRTAAAADTTLTANGHTTMGAVLGTPAYMSPEQLAGRIVDHRTDIFSFGILLYEMSTGRGPFAGTTSVELASAILRDTPTPVTEARPDLPVGLSRIVRRCLEKDPRQRFQSASDLAFALRGLTETSAASGKAATPSQTRYRVPALALCLVALLGGFILARVLAPPPGPDVFSYRYIPFPTEEENPFNPVISPDGKSIAYNGAVQGITQVFARKLDSPVAVQLTHEGADSRYPFWSPDQSRIYYISADPSGRAVWSVGVAGGVPQLVLGGIGGYIGLDGAALSRDGRTLAVLKREEGSAGRWSVWLSSPPGAAPRKYMPAPFERSWRPERARRDFLRTGSTCC
jgi:serine/threonine protein kinase